jgi:(3R)-3-hydroxyacyl-CoA dehydrogenase / 3a,7a,12a-trihydroxy-5b-cholest-24-enoyl-CoA hydratase / enoyl-CoA hydratase 2
MNEFINAEKALGAQLPEAVSAYDERDVSLYALAVGAGATSSDLRFVYENHGDGFVVLPTFGVVPAVNALFTLAAEGKTAPGLHYGLDRVLHGEQWTHVLKALPPKASLKHRSFIKDIFDKGNNAVVVTHTDTFDFKTRELLVQNELSMVVRGAGGFGGVRGPSGNINEPPARAADVTLIEKTNANQALLYRLLGDWNPLHVDPEFAALFGFEKPILHGLCTYGYLARAAIANCLEGQVHRFKSIQARFAESVFPGESLRIELWNKSSTRVVARVWVVERNVVCISNAAVELYAE